MTQAHVTISLDDVVKAGSVEAAIRAWAKQSDDTGSGPVGPTFSTSGPGSGWSTQHGAADYAERAIQEGALYYLDESDGRLATAVREDDGSIMVEGVRHSIEWSDDSVVRLECPTMEEAIAHPSHVAMMIRAVLDYHGAMSDRAAWATLVLAIQEAAEELEEFDADDLRAD